jgi:hypothetical protein
MRDLCESLYQLAISEMPTANPYALRKQEPILNMIHYVKSSGLVVLTPRINRVRGAMYSRS